MSIKLPDPLPGYEWTQKWGKMPGMLGDYIVGYELRPIRKLYDWSKTGPNVLVRLPHGAARLTKEVISPTYLLEGVWQAHIGGDPCPVDPDATMVDHRNLGCSYGPRQASMINWDNDVIYRVTGLVEGYSYE